MTARRPCPPAPGPLEEYAARFDDLFFSLAQRRGFRDRLHPELQQRSAWIDHDGELPIIEGTLIRLKV
ncbi:hypothetical protein AB0H73_39795, partial [Streptomyces olivoreticuli]